MTIEEIFKQEKANDVVTLLKKGRTTEQPNVQEAEKALKNENHDVNDHIKRKDKRVKVDTDDDGESAQKVIDTNGESTNYRTEKVARIALALQRLIIKRTVSFTFGTPPNYECSPNDDLEAMVQKALDKILKHTKTKSLNRKIGRAVFGFKECAELWYPVEAPNKKYGFESKYKLRVALLSPAFGDTLFPYFDEMGDLIAFSREFSRMISATKGEEYFETWTAENHYLFKNTNNGYELVEGYPKANPIGKIPVVYAYQDHFETEDVDALIDRLETLLSNFADTNDYHASPKIFTTGQINGWSKKGESGAVIEGEDGATMQYVSWQSAPEAVKLEIETILRFIYTITQTPDISFDAIKGLGAISGIALKLLFMDAHLKVQDKCEIFDDYLDRRVNVILAFIAMMNTKLADACETIEVEPEIVPYMLTNEIDELNYWLTANGNKPVLSQEESVEKAGLSNNVDKTIQKLKDESASANSFIFGEPNLEGDA